VLVAANLYLETVAAGARVEAAKAQLETARALTSRRWTCVAPAPSRASKCCAPKCGSASNSSAPRGHQRFEKAKLQLARMIGLPLRQEFTLTERCRRCRCRS
jgi:hypothetical protein